MSMIQTAVAPREPLGVTVMAIGGKPKVATLSPDGPFVKAGVSIGDLLTHVNGASVHDKSAEGTKCSSSS